MHLDTGYQFTGADKNAAKKLLEVCKYNVEMAINMHVEAEDDVTPTIDGEVASTSPVVVPVDDK